MRDLNNMEDLLRGQRRRRGRRRRRWLLVVALAVGAVAWWYFYMRETEQDRQTHRADAVGHARELVRHSLREAHRPLEVDAPAAAEHTQADEALTATWSEGEAVSMRGEIAKHQSIFEALEKRGLPAAKIQPVVSATSEEFDFRKSRPGDKWRVEVNKEGHITKFEYQTSPEDVWETVRNSNGSYACTKIDVPVDKRRATLAGRVNSSLWKAFERAGESGQLIYRFADIFAYTIDFNRESRPGDRFALVVEKVFLDGQFLRYGKILAAEYVNRGDINRAFLHENDDGTGGYYTAKGKSLKRQFLKSPLASIRVTSRYGMRHHPVLGRDRMHRGVDYGAPTGTPIRAVADGTVRFAGRKGANGNLIVLSHANGYTTLYAHLHDIADGIHPGRRVSRKTVIGEVGSTGRSTGPHLHFGMKQHGRYVNPQKVDFARGEPLKGRELERFRNETVAPLRDALKEARAELSATRRTGDYDGPSLQKAPDP